MALPVCTIDENGIFKPDYATVLAYFQEQFRAIFGQDIDIDPDTQDGQQIAIFAAAVDDANAMALQVYNAFSPSTARGVGLSSVVKINGIKRLVASNSTVDLTLIGQAGTTITGGIAKDNAGNQWLLPTSVTIPAGGSITVTAIAKDAGAIQALPGAISTIGTPTRGWQSVTNANAAAPGQPVELDAQLRQRQTISTALPSLTVFEGTMGAVASVAGVDRLKGYENDTGTTDANGIPAHSISLVVQGGDATAIAQAIAAKKTAGTGTYGTTNVTITDEYGVARAIKFYRPTAATIKVAISLKALVGYTTAIETSIKQAVVDFINGLEIGGTSGAVEWAEVFVPANLALAGNAKTYKITALTIAKNGGSFGTADLPIAFNEAPSAALTDVTITVVP
ncbi:bacteriophage protein [Bosea sp. UNC402CLCol]|uniref:baseplate J/gp47 family protein n=1 Tax=Bosea sp. UNC402CLCol TaxID=1510531 RepID=UPI00056F9CEF|nr:bacteriophage protein [Bosea sp. UNC402CLCol]